ncbi:hypothetical protein [Sphaerotilus montanus]|uniref:hypothetical protein n=1 Tax=Sphaerotilus montanus TaxID=522889 RepID=UPI003FA1E571
MRQMVRKPLPKNAADYLKKKQDLVDSGKQTDIENLWKAARATKSIGEVLRTIQTMCGPRERCMYCLDSHGCDIEHFRPKAAYPGHAFQWPNLLLCCTECGRFKGDRFPTDAHNQALLIDPTNENPWDHLDFDPETGNLVARFDLIADDWSIKGTKTVEALQLDRREALRVVYQTTFRRLARILRDALNHPADWPVDSLCERLKETDDHGLLPWCFGDIGRTVEPFSDLLHQQPDTWIACEAAFR